MKYLPLFILALVISMSLIFFFRQKNTSLPAVTNSLSELSHRPDRSQVSLTIGSRPLSVELVNSSASITQGLSGRSEIGSDGMLFVFGEERWPQFWMKDMQFDLDLVWIRQGRILEITSHVPHPDPSTPLTELPRYQSSQSVEAVLEIPAGKAAEWGFKSGDPVVIAN